MTDRSRGEPGAFLKRRHQALCGAGVGGQVHDDVAEEGGRKADRSCRVTDGVVCVTLRPRERRGLGFGPLLRADGPRAGGLHDPGDEVERRYERMSSFGSGGCLVH